MENPEFSHYEDASYRPTVIWEEVTKGEQVGGDTPQKHISDSTSDLDTKKEQGKAVEKNTVSQLSVKEMQKYIDSWKDELRKVAWMNPDWPPAAWNPEAESKLAWRMENSLNMVA